MNQKSNHIYLKIGMIPLLGGILYCMLPGKQSVPGEIAADSKGAAANSPTKEEPSEKSNERDFVSKPDWPLFKLSELNNIDPFDKRMIFPESVPKASSSDPTDSDKQTLVSAIGRSRASSLENIKVQAIFQSTQGIAALVGEHVIHVGDLLQDGTQVIDITAEHLILASPTLASPTLSSEVGS